MPFQASRSVQNLPTLRPTFTLATWLEERGDRHSSTAVVRWQQPNVSYVPNPYSTASKGTPWPVQRVNCVTLNNTRQKPLTTTHAGEDVVAEFTARAARWKIKRATNFIASDLHELRKANQSPTRRARQSFALVLRYAQDSLSLMYVVQQPHLFTINTARAPHLVQYVYC